MLGSNGVGSVIGDRFETRRNVFADPRAQHEDRCARPCAQRRGHGESSIRAITSSTMERAVGRGVGQRVSPSRPLQIMLFGPR